MSELLSRDRTIGSGAAALILVSDQLVKWLIAGPLGLADELDRMDLLPFFDLTRVHNRGVSFGLFEATSAEMRWIIVGVTALIAIAVAIWMFREKLLGDIVALGAILGGALGNIIDRIRYGYVLDYADFHIGDFRPFLIFNIADAAITIGVVIILARSLFLGNKATESAEAPPAR